MKLVKQYIYIVISVFFLSCSDIIESDLTTETISIIAPSDSARNDKTSQTFLWEDLREKSDIDLEFYNLQIARPGFEKADLLVLDTNVTSPSYTYSLEPGEYQWRVRGENLNTKTPYSTYTLFVDSSFNLTNTTLVLISPLTGQSIKVINSGGLLYDFEWERLTGADSYRVQLVYGSFNGSPTPIETITTTNTIATFTLPKDKDINGVRISAGDYEWRVTAKNINTNTSTSSTSRFTVDTTKTTTN